MAQWNTDDRTLHANGSAFGGKATLSRRCGRLARLAVSVLGEAPTIPESDRRRIFNPFEQGGHRLRGKLGGVGLGLSEARTIARWHGGELEQGPRETSRELHADEFDLTVSLAGTARWRREAVGTRTGGGGSR